MSHEFDNYVLELLKQKGFYPNEYIGSFKKFKEQFPDKRNFYSSLTIKKISDNYDDHVLKVWDRFEMKTTKGYRDLYLKCDVLLLVDVLQILEIAAKQLRVLPKSLYECASFKLECKC